MLFVVTGSTEYNKLFKEIKIIRIVEVDAVAGKICQGTTSIPPSRPYLSYHK